MGMKNKKSQKEDKIISVLYEKSGGLTIQDLAESLKVSTVTMAKYLEVLVAQDKIYRRVVGSAKIHYHLKWAKAAKYIK